MHDHQLQHLVAGCHGVSFLVIVWHPSLKRSSSHLDRWEAHDIRDLWRLFGRRRERPPQRCHSDCDREEECKNTGGERRCWDNKPIRPELANGLKNGVCVMNLRAASFSTRTSRLLGMRGAGTPLSSECNDWIDASECLHRGAHGEMGKEIGLAIFGSSRSSRGTHIFCVWFAGHGNASS